MRSSYSCQPILILLLLLHHFLAGISQSTNDLSSLRRLQTTFTILPVNTTDPICARTITHSLIDNYRGIYPQDSNKILPGIIWQYLLINNRGCSSSQFATYATYITPKQNVDPAGNPDLVSPWFAEAVDNSARKCEAFAAALPARYFFTDNLPKFRERLVRSGVLPNNVATRPIRGVIYMFAVEFKPRTDSTIRRSKVCVYVDASAKDADANEGLQPPPTPQPLPIGNVPENGTSAANDEEQDPQPTEEQDRPACFPQGMLVKRKDDSLIPIENLRVGDSIVGGLVIANSHVDHYNVNNYIRLRLENRLELLLSKSHLIPVFQRGAIPAKDVSKGDYVYIAHTEKQWKIIAVTDIEIVERTGIYAPVTSSGEMIVQNVRVSCYTNILPISTSHAALTPIRWIVYGGVNVEMNRFFDVLRLFYKWVSTMYSNNASIWSQKRIPLTLVSGKYRTLMDATLMSNPFSIR